MQEHAAAMEGNDTFRGKSEEKLLAIKKQETTGVYLPDHRILIDRRYTAEKK